MLADDADGKTRIHVFVHAVGGKQEHITLLHWRCLIVDLQLRAHAHGARQIGGVLRHAQTVVDSQRLQHCATHAIHARIAHMKNMCGSGFDNQRGQRAHIAAPLVVAMLAMPRLRMQPRVCRRQHALRGFLDRPRLRGAEVVLQKPLDRSLAGDMAHRAAADAIGQRYRYPLGA